MPIESPAERVGLMDATSNFRGCPLTRATARTAAAMGRIAWIILPASSRSNGVPDFLANLLHWIFHRWSLRDDAIENWAQESAVPLDNLPIGLGNSFLHRARGFGRNQFDAPHEDPRQLRWSRVHVEREKRVHRARGDDINQPRSFLKPRIAPGLHHRLGFLRK